MALIRISSPHVTNRNQTGTVMKQVLLATLPGIAAMTYFFGWGTLINLIWASVLAVGFEAIMIRIRKRPLGFYLRDYSAVVTAVLLALALPPFAPWWLTLVGVFVAIVIAKHLYGGLGQNPFNPAMIAYALLLVSFPVDMTRWTAPFVMQGDEAWHVLSFGDTLSAIFGGLNQAMIDNFTGATPLDSLKHRGGLTTDEAFSSIAVLTQGIGAWHAVSAAYLMGGIYMLYRKVFTWHTPLSMLLAIAISSSLLYIFYPDGFAGPFFHLSVGATMLGAFFIATDPVSAATSNRGKIWYGAGIGLLIVIIRTWGSYPDAIAFAVLLMNLAAPLIDQYTQPRTYGHAKAKKGIKESA